MTPFRGLDAQIIINAIPRTEDFQLGLKSKPAPLNPDRILRLPQSAQAPRPRRFCGDDDGVHSRGGDVGEDDLGLRPAAARQTLAWLFSGTPASARIAASSPDWNISRVMSQPPTNSPLT